MVWVRRRRGGWIKIIGVKTSRGDIGGGPIVSGIMARGMGRVRDVLVRGSVHTAYEAVWGSVIVGRWRRKVFRTFMVFLFLPRVFRELFVYGHRCRSMRKDETKLW